MKNEDRGRENAPNELTREGQRNEDGGRENAPNEPTVAWKTCRRNRPPRNSAKIARAASLQSSLPMNSHHLYSGMTALNRFVRGFSRQRSAILPPGPQHLERMQVDSVSQRCAWL